jgi:YD repeat-containing protein
VTTQTRPDGEAILFDYDGVGNVTAVTPPGRLGQRRAGAGFLYQGQLRVVAEPDGAGAVVSRFVYGTGVNVPGVPGPGRGHASPRHRSSRQTQS